jgi:peroxiredoxin
MHKTLLTGLLLLLLSGCGPSEPVTDWRLVVQLPDVELPVKLHLATDGSEAWFSNGVERVHVPEITRAGDTWTLRFPAFNNTFVLHQDGNHLEGTLTLVKRGYEQTMEVVGGPDPGYLFRETPHVESDVTGRWEVAFVEDDGTESFAIAEFDQQGAQLSGTFLTPKGDYRYLAGEMDSGMLHLSTFDGAHAFVFHAHVQPDGSLQGDFWSGTKWHESWTAQRNFDAQLPDAYELTFIKEGYDGIEFSFPGLDGEAVSLDDEKYRDKVVLVTLSGTWCPNCADEVEFLSRYFSENRERGLEIITLLYEHFEEFDLAAAQGKALVDKHDIEFDVLIAGSSDKTLAAETLPMLNHVLAFPTMIFIDRNGEVRRIHTGFSGPGTGEHYQRFKEEFYAQMEELLAEN